MNPLSALFVFFALVGAVIALLGHAARSNSPAPSMVTNNLSPIAWGISIVSILIALAAYQPAKAADLLPPDCWPWWQCNGTKETNHPNCKCWEGK